MKEDICQFETSNCPSTQYTFCRDSTGCTYRVIGRADCQLSQRTKSFALRQHKKSRTSCMHKSGYSEHANWMHKGMCSFSADKAWIIETNFCFIINVQEAEGG
ncbi:unnamed protein product [Wuchereria bancrofti]|uniref:Uncharacterized protein n=1 Tax=Wuchereria bancrofti TaxID=6293 RepID=A0A3P7DUW6_WUCBA|nr:unnamed protein product [Wuchereria bancrofti]